MRALLTVFALVIVGCAAPRAQSDRDTTTSAHAVGEITLDELAPSSHAADVLQSLPSWFFNADRAELTRMMRDQGLDSASTVKDGPIKFVGDGGQASLDVKVIRSGKSTGAGLIAEVVIHPVAGYGATEIYRLLRLENGWKIIARERA